MEVEHKSVRTIFARVRNVMHMLYDHSPRQVYYYLWEKTHRTGKGVDCTEQCPCVFVLSTGRVGTETLAALFALAPQFLSYHEPQPKLYRLSKLAYECGEDPKARSIIREAFRLARTELLQYSRSCGMEYVETSPQITFLAPVIRDLIPNVRFIHLARDPYEVIRSGMRRRWYAGNAADETRIVPSPDSVDGRKWYSYDTFQKNAWLWSETNRWILKFSATLAPNQTLFLRSEDLFAGKSETLASLFSFAGIPVPSLANVNQVLNKKLNAQKSGEFPSTMDWTDEMKAALKEIIGETAARLGYTLT